MVTIRVRARVRVRDSARVRVKVKFRAEWVTEESPKHPMLLCPYIF